MSARRYVSADRLVELQQAMSTEDWAILADVRRMRLATAADLQALIGLREQVHVRKVRRRLQRLDQLGVLFRLERRVGGAARGSAGFVYGVGIGGQRLLDPSGAVSPRRPWTPRPSWLQHALASSHLYLVLRRAEAQGQLRLLDFESEPECWRPMRDGQGGSVLKPDAFVRLEVGPDLVSVFVEVDCATESPATLASKCQTYQQHWLDGSEQAEHGVYPEVLWLAPSLERCRVIERVVARQPEEARALHRVSPYHLALDAFTNPP